MTPSDEQDSARLKEAMAIVKESKKGMLRLMIIMMIVGFGFAALMIVFVFSLLGIIKI